MKYMMNEGLTLLEEHFEKTEDGGIYLNKKGKQIFINELEKANLASRGDSTVNNYVVVEPSQYSQTEYDAIDANFRNYYNKNEKAGTILATFPDVENNQLYAVVTTASKETQQGMSKLFGSKVKMTVKR